MRANVPDFEDFFFFFLGGWVFGGRIFGSRGFETKIHHAGGLILRRYFFRIHVTCSLLSSELGDHLGRYCQPSYQKGVLCH